MKNIESFKTLKDVEAITSLMYRLGWDERNGGNISVMIDEDEIKEYLDLNDVKRNIPLSFDASKLSGKYFLVTATGSYFRRIIEDPENLLGIFRVSKDGHQAELLWGFNDGGSFTSELPTHLMVHQTRLEVDSTNRVVMHCHPISLLTMTHVFPLNSDKDFTLALWRTMTESIVIFPEGIGVLPWMQSGTNEIGIATSQKILSYRLVVWGLHGIYGVGSTIDAAFGLIEAAEKAADIYLRESNFKVLNDITDDDLRSIAKHYELKNVRYEFLK